MLLKLRLRPPNFTAYSIKIRKEPPDWAALSVSLLTAPGKEGFGCRPYFQYSRPWPEKSRQKICITFLIGAFFIFLVPIGLFLCTRRQRRRRIRQKMGILRKFRGFSLRLSFFRTSHNFFMSEAPLGDSPCLPSSPESAKVKAAP